tara:strand:- start:361 stop:741 length:381 start_codon:yes stop_codon:yes gene_type:complete
MYALINLSGKQIKIEEGKDIKIPFQSTKVGSKIKIENVLFFDDGKKKQIGNPYIKSLSFEGKIVSHGEENKILVYKKKRRKGYEKKRGHKQKFSMIKVEKLVSKSKKKTSSTTAKKKTTTKKNTKE